MPKVQACQGQPDGGRRRAAAAAAASSTSLAEINVVPLVDVMLVLLIIFMVTAPMMQRGVDVNLPVARRARSRSASERLFVTVPLAYRQDAHGATSATSRSASTCWPSACGRRCDGTTDKEVFLRGDGGVQLQELMDVIDRLKDAGVEKVGIVAKLPGGAVDAMEAVTDVLRRARARAERACRRMVAVSLVAHVVLVAALVAGARPLAVERSDSRRDVMTIILGGAPGPRAAA